MNYVGKLQEFVAQGVLPFGTKITYGECSAELCTQFKRFVIVSMGDSGSEIKEMGDAQSSKQKAKSSAAEKMIKRLENEGLLKEKPSSVQETTLESNYVGKLQELYQKGVFPSAAIYNEKEHLATPSQPKLFTCTVTVGAYSETAGPVSSKKSAKHEAARLMLLHFEELTNNATNCSNPHISLADQWENKSSTRPSADVSKTEFLGDSFSSGFTSEIEDPLFKLFADSAGCSSSVWSQVPSPSLTNDSLSSPSVSPNSTLSFNVNSNLPPPQCSDNDPETSVNELEEICKTKGWNHTKPLYYEVPPEILPKDGTFLLFLKVTMWSKSEYLVTEGMGNSLDAARSDAAKRCIRILKYADIWNK